MNAIAYPIADAAKVAGVSRTHLFRAVKDGRLRARRNGNRVLVLADDLKCFLESLPEARPAA